MKPIGSQWGSSPTKATAADRVVARANRARGGLVDVCRGCGGPLVPAQPASAEWGHTCDACYALAFAVDERRPRTRDEDGDDARIGLVIVRRRDGAEIGQGTRPCTHPAERRVVEGIVVEGTDGRMCLRCGARVHLVDGRWTSKGRPP